MTTDAEALAVLRRAVPEITPRRAALVLCISRLETHHGDRWATTPGAEYGVGSGNVGAIHAGAGWDGAVFPAPEARWNPDTEKVEEYEGSFRLYDNLEEGFADLYRLLVNRYPATIELADANRWSDVSASLYDEGYYTGRKPRDEAIALHRKAFFGAFPSVSKVVNADMTPPAPDAVSSDRMSFAKVGALAALPLALLLTAAGLALHATRTGRRKR